MKRILSFAVSMVLCAMIFAIPFSASAETVQKSNNNEVLVNSYVEHYDDGTYAEVKVMKNVNNSKLGISLSSSNWTQSGSKQYTWYMNDGTPAMRFTLYGTFDVYGSGATCTDTSYDTNSYDNACSVQSPESYASDNQAIGSCTFVRKFLFVTVSSKYVRLVLSCDGNGNLS